MGDDPVLLFQKNVLDFPFGSAKRHPQCNFSIRVDADTAGLSAAADDCVGKVIEFALILYSIVVFHEAAFLVSSFVFSEFVILVVS